MSVLYAVTEAGAGVLLVMHPKKGDAAEGQATRGSAAITAFVDVIVELRRFEPERREDTRRVLTAYSRFEETPSEVVLEYELSSGYRAVGSKSDARSSDRLHIVTDIVPSQPPGWTVEQILAGWSDDTDIPKPGERTLRRDLDRAVEAGRLATVGAGVRGDPLRYHQATTFVADSFPASSTP